MSGWDNRLVGQVGEFLVCAELGRRGLAATPFRRPVPGLARLGADSNGGPTRRPLSGGS